MDKTDCIFEQQHAFLLTPSRILESASAKEQSLELAVGIPHVDATETGTKKEAEISFQGTNASIRPLSTTEALEGAGDSKAVLQFDEEIEARNAQGRDLEEKEIIIEIVFGAGISNSKLSRKVFEFDLLQELCYCQFINAEVHKMRVLTLQRIPGSVTARLLLRPAASALFENNLELVEEFQSQMSDRGSFLRAGKYGSQITSLRVLTAIESQKILLQTFGAEPWSQTLKDPSASKPIPQRTQRAIERLHMIQEGSDHLISVRDGGQRIDMPGLSSEVQEENTTKEEVFGIRQMLEDKHQPQLNDGEQQSGPWMEIVKKSRLESSRDCAALLLQRCMRGMMDRIFFRKFKKSLIQHEPEHQNQEHRKWDGIIQNTERKRRNKGHMVSSPKVEVDGYLSLATKQRLEERGEVLDRSDVSRRSKQMRKIAHSASIDILSPGQGFCWHLGQVSQIKWKMSGNVRIQHVGLYLYFNGEPIHTIVKAVPNLGKYIYTLPEIFYPSEELYQILVIAEAPKLPNCHSFSEPFTIAPQKEGHLLKLSPVTPMIQITFPCRPAWCWSTGTVNTISWKSSGVVQNVQIDMMRHGEFSFRIVDNLMNCGAFPFNLPPNVPTGEGYQIRVRSVVLKKACGVSAHFSIVDRQVAQAVPKRFSVDKQTKMQHVESDNRSLLAPLQPATALRRIWSLTDSCLGPIDQDNLQMPATKAVSARAMPHSGGWSPSRARLQTPENVSTLGSQNVKSVSDSLLHGDTIELSIDDLPHGGGAGRCAQRKRQDRVLIPNGNLGKSMNFALDLSRSIGYSEQTGHHARDADDDQQSEIQGYKKMDNDRLTLERSGESDFDSVSFRLRTMYSVKEHGSGVWLKPEFERLTGRSMMALKSRGGNTQNMARVFAGSPHLADVNHPWTSPTPLSGAHKRSDQRRIPKTGKGLQRRELDKPQVLMKPFFAESRKQSTADRHKILTTAEEFLQNRDKIFAEQLAVIKQEDDSSAGLLDVTSDSAGCFPPALVEVLHPSNSVGRLNMSVSGVMLPAVDNLTSARYPHAVRGVTDE